MKRYRGFTLMELLIAVSIFSVIALCLYSVFSGGIRVWQRQEQGFRYGYSVRLALDKMARELRNVINYSQPDGSQQGIEKNQELMFRGSAQELSFMTVMAGEILRVRYVFEEGMNQKNVLKRKIVFQKDGFREEKEKEETVIGDLSDLSFEYAYKSGEGDSAAEWKDTWGEEDKIPRGVRVTLEIDKKIFKKTIFIPLGALTEVAP